MANCTPCTCSAQHQLRPTQAALLLPLPPPLLLLLLTHEQLLLQGLLLLSGPRVDHNEQPGVTIQTRAGHPVGGTQTMSRHPAPV